MATHIIDTKELRDICLANVPHNGANLRDYVDALNRGLDRQLDQIRTQLRELVDDQVKALSNRLDEKFKADAEALVLARTGMEHTLAEMNNIRDQLATQKGNFVEQNEFNLKLDAVIKRVRDLENSSVSNDAVSNYRRWIIGLAIGFVILFLGAIISVIVNLTTGHRI